MTTTNTRPVSAFTEEGLKTAIQKLSQEIRTLYASDGIPWVVGYSGGKDSTATLQMVWLALSELPADQRTKTVHVISTDTLVENPIVARWVNHSLETMAAAAKAQGLPIEAHRLTPEVTDSFWVNLIGKGYPAPKPRFRWCTERLKIKPSNRFIRDLVQAYGEAIVVLGTRRQESQARGRRMEEFSKQRARELLNPHTTLPNSFIYSPIEHWSNDDVWMFLMQVPNPWGYANRDLLTMYQGASPDGECPLVIDTTTPSCGDSRFGCWTCTLVDQDKSMSAMIQNDEDKEWMLPLLEIRNALDDENDRHLRDFRRMTGAVQLFNDRAIHGPYTQEARERWLRKVLDAQTWIRANGPDHVRDIDLISIDELHEIRRIWVFDKHEIEDSVPVIYAENTGSTFPGGPLDEHLPLGAEEIRILRDLSGDDTLHFQLTRELLDIERRYRFLTRRSGLYEDLEAAFRKHFYDGEEDATDRARQIRDARALAQEGHYQPVEIALNREEPEIALSSLPAREEPAK